MTPAPGAEVRELRVARVRGHARRLFWSALVLVAVAGAVGYFTGNLPAPSRTGCCGAAGLVVLLLVIIPFLRWFAHLHRDDAPRRRAVGRLRPRAHQIGTPAATRSRAARSDPADVGAGTLTLSNGVDAPLRMVDVPSVRLCTKRSPTRSR
jgi:hypothetical protein